MDDEVDVRRIEREVADELLRLHANSYGKGASHGHAYVLDDLVVCVLDDIELQPNEAFLIDSGHAEAAIRVRGQYQQAIEPTFRAVVERITGRAVISYASLTKLDPHYVVEIFRLVPHEERGK